MQLQAAYQKSSSAFSSAETFLRYSAEVLDAAAEDMRCCVRHHHVQPQELSATAILALVVTAASAALFVLVTMAPGVLGLA